MVLIRIERDNTAKNISFSGTVEALLAKLKVNAETVLVVRNNEVLTEDEPIKDDDQIEILSVISGG